MANKRWRELSDRQKRSIAVSSAIQFSLLIAALVDICRRPQEEIRGKKWMWAAASFVNFIGPLSYFIFGRRR